MIAQMAIVLAETICELSAVSPLGGVPSGELYSQVQQHLDIHQYEEIIHALVKSGLVTNKSHLLVWVGPKFDRTTGVVDMKQKPGRQASEKAVRSDSEPRRKAQTVGAGKAPRAAADASPSSLVVPEGNGIILPVGQNIALPEGDSALSSSDVNHVSQEKLTMATLKYRKTDKSGSSSYAIEGLKSSVYFNKGMFAGNPPETLEIALPDGFAFGEPGQAAKGAVAMTKEEREAAAAKRKAEQAAMTPQEKAAKKIADARVTLEKAEKLAAKLAAAQAPASV